MQVQLDESAARVLSHTFLQIEFNSIPVRANWDLSASANLLSHSEARIKYDQTPRALSNK